jgi:hypothetical protein
VKMLGQRKMEENQTDEVAKKDSAEAVNCPEVQNLGTRPALFQPIAYGAYDMKRGPIFLAHFSEQCVEVWKYVEDGKWTGPASLILATPPLSTLQTLLRRAERGERLFPAPSELDRAKNALRRLFGHRGCPHTRSVESVLGVLWVDRDLSLWWSLAAISELIEEGEFAYVTLADAGEATGVTGRQMFERTAPLGSLRIIAKTRTVHGSKPRRRGTARKRGRKS